MPARAPRRAARPLLLLLGVATLAVLASSCAYYNTFYLARRYYFKATNGEPYEVDREGSAQSANYTKTIDYCKKLMAQYPKSKYVDDAYVLWARSLIGRDDPLQTITMLQDFATRYPKSEQKQDVTFYLGLACHNARRFTQSVDAFDEFLKVSPKSSLVPYAHLERSRSLVALGRFDEAAADAGVILEKFPKSVLVDKARLQRAEARFQASDFEGARADYSVIASRATSDADQFQFLMREADCLESARRYDDELALLRSELAHTVAPVVIDQSTGTTAGGQVPPPPAPVSASNNTGAFVASEKYGRLTLRVGTALLLAGHLPDALQQYDNVLKDYPKTVLSAEAQYRIGYAYETVADDFDRALLEYAKVKNEFGLTQYTQQAQQRADDLGRIMQFRKGAGADSTEKQAEAGFLTAERYLFELKRPDRALVEYANVANTYPGTPVAARALTAQAWVLLRRMDKPHEADSLFWKVVNEYPATQAQLAARDYLESEGTHVPDSLIVAPAAPAPEPVDTTRTLTPIPPTPPLGGMRPDSLGGPPRGPLDHLGHRGGGMLRDSLGMPVTVPVPPATGDTLTHPRGMSPPGSTAPPPATAPPVNPPPPASAPPDTSHKGGGPRQPPVAVEPRGTR
jgi:TolA-binding protein